MSAPDILRRILASKAEEVEARAARTPLPDLQARIDDAELPRGFAGRLQVTVEGGRPAVIAELKKASPSQGVLRAGFDPAAIAASYERGGATCLSVLTEEPSFQGSLGFMVASRAAVSLPVLRKDFMYDTYQVVEARAHGADCILIIMAALDDAAAKELEDVAIAHGMDALLEIHSERELERALRLRSRLIGINNRDLNTFETSLATSKRLAAGIPADRIAVSESGIFSQEDIEYLVGIGISAFLVGESLMRERDVEAATRALIHRPQGRLRAAQ